MTAGEADAAHPVIERHTARRLGLIFLAAILLGAVLAALLFLRHHHRLVTDAAERAAGGRPRTARLRHARASRPVGARPDAARRRARLLSVDGLRQGRRLREVDERRQGRPREGRPAAGRAAIARGRPAGRRRGGGPRDQEADARTLRAAGQEGLRLEAGLRDRAGAVRGLARDAGAGAELSVVRDRCARRSRARSPRATSIRARWSRPPPARPRARRRWSTSPICAACASWSSCSRTPRPSCTPAIRPASASIRSRTSRFRRRSAAAPMRSIRARAPCCARSGSTTTIASTREPSCT